jgi:hypothetical protein
MNLTPNPISVEDCRDAIGVDVNGDISSQPWHKPGALYVPAHGYVDVIYISTVARSYENGAIRKFLLAGHITAAFIVGAELAAAIAGASTPSGRVNIVGAATTAAVVFAAPFPPFIAGVPNYSVVLTAAEGTVGFAMVNCWATNIANTGFTANISAAPGGANIVVVNWMAEPD